MATMQIQSTESSTWSGPQAQVRLSKTEPVRDFREVKAPAATYTKPCFRWRRSFGGNLNLPTLGDLPKKRFVLLCLLTLALTSISQTGCQVMGRFRGQDEVSSPIAFVEIPTKDQILTHLATQTERVNQLQSDVRVSVDGMPTLRGTLAIEKPDRLRMNAGLLGVTELGIDVGSNRDVFWFWAKVAAPGQEPGIYFARHDEYQNSELQRLIPVEPAWLIDALGLVKFEPTDRVEGPFQRPDGRLELVTYRNIGGQTTVRVSAIDARYGWVSQHSIYDSNGRILAYANSVKYQHYPEYNVSLPSRIEITAYNPDGSEFKLSVDASRYKINSIYGDPEKLWVMPNPGDVPLYDLVRGRKTDESSYGQGRDLNSNIHDHRTSSTGRGHTKSFLNRIR